MTGPLLPELIDIGPGAVKRMAAFCRTRAAGPDGRESRGGSSRGGSSRGGSSRGGSSRLRLVADRSTWTAAGVEAERELRAVGLSVRPTIFDEPHLSADAVSILRLLIDDDPLERLYVAVGSGTVTDIVRFVAHRTGRDFVSLATAPSVDAYASVVAPVVADGMKVTVAAAAPLAVFADTEILARSPRPMIAAGFGDMLCKFSAAADWRLGALLWGESFDASIAQRSIDAARSCAEAASSIGAAMPEGLAKLMAALVESGLCMAEAGHSRPASGAEHHYSHYWEMRLLKEGRPPILHGLKVAIGTLETARLWDELKRLTSTRAAELLAASRLPARSDEEARIREAFGAAGDDVGAAAIIAAHERFLSMGETEYEDLKARILASWDEILDIARIVPTASETERLLQSRRLPDRSARARPGVRGDRTRPQVRALHPRPVHGQEARARVRNSARIDRAGSRWSYRIYGPMSLSTLRI